MKLVAEIKEKKAKEELLRQARMFPKIFLVRNVDGRMVFSFSRKAEKTVNWER